MSETITASGIIDALDRKYGQKAENNEQWVVIREARSGAGFDGNRRQCDYLAINTYPGRGLQLIGHEIKVSAADGKRELEEPEKAELFARHCRRWWMVMPAPLASQMEPEIPPSWGVMSVSTKGRITEVRKAPTREPDVLPFWWWIGWLAQLDRRDKRAVRSEVDQLVRERVDKEREAWERSWHQRAENQQAHDEELRKNVDALREATGIDLNRMWTPDLRRLKEVWDLDRRGPELEVVVGHLRHSADLLEALVNDHNPRNEHYAEGESG